MPTFCYIFKTRARTLVTNGLSKLVLGTRKKNKHNDMIYICVFFTRKLNLDHYIRLVATATWTSRANK